MDTSEDAREYDAMDHSVVNAQFVTDLLATAGWLELHASRQAPLQVLDLGVGTGQIVIEMARRAPAIHITAVDAAESMLAFARTNIAAAGVTDRIELVLADAKQLPFNSGAFPVVISNSIVHHIPEPRSVFAEVARVIAPAGLLFHRDLARPIDEAQLKKIVAAYAGDANAYQQKLFAESLHAALTLAEVQQLVGELGFPADTVRMTSDRHWTWIGT